MKNRTVMPAPRLRQGYAGSFPQTRPPKLEERRRKAGIHEKSKDTAWGLSWIPAFAGMTIILFATLAHAGNVNFSNGKGLWQSTMCQRPVPPVFVGLAPDAPAGTMNAATGSYNLFVKQTQDYLACLSAEAKADSEASASLIMANVGRQMRNAQTDVKRAYGQLFGPGPIQPQPTAKMQPALAMPPQAQEPSEPLFQPADQ